MNTIITYLEKYGDNTLEEVPFNEVDSLILCQLSYLRYDGFVGGASENRPAVSVRSIFESEEYESIFQEYWYKKENHKLFANFVNSKRFGDTVLNCYENIINEEKDAQFSAITFILPDKSVYIAYRGTDATLVGWKEDMKLAYSKPLRSHELAAAYMKDVAGRFAGNFRTGGHSKGGNLAVYAAMNTPYSVRDRIIDVFDHDGPGFRPEILDAGHFDELKDRVHKYIPKSSIVGIIMEEQLPYEVIESWGMGALQHNTYTWKCNGGELVRSKGMTGIKELSDKSINEWIFSLSEAEVDAFIDTVYDIFTANEARNLFDLVKNPTGALSSGFSAYKDLSEETKEALFVMLKRLMGIMSENAYDKLISTTRKLWDEIDRQVNKITNKKM